MPDHGELENTNTCTDSLQTAVHLVTKTDATLEVLAPMLDVHAPHEDIHTWQSFFIHVATICVGLLIAIGLEQTVEFLHHRHQLKESQQSLRTEHEDNRRIMGYRLKEFRRYNKALQGNLAGFIYLQQHPGTPMEKLPDAISWSAVQISAYTSAWSSAMLATSPR